MAEEVPASREEFVKAYRERAEDFGSAVGVVAGVAMLATGVLPLSANFLSLFVFAPLAVYSCMLVGSLGISALSGAAAGGAYKRYAAHEIAKAKFSAMNDAMVEEVQHSPIIPVEDELLPDMLPAPEVPKKRWTDLFKRHASHAEDIAEEKTLAEGEGRVR